MDPSRLRMRLASGSFPLAVLLLSFLMDLGSPAPEARQASPARSRRVILLSVDGAADWVVDRLIEQGKAPEFAAIAQAGVAAESMISAMPSLTAVGHVTLWTGTTSLVHGISGNTVVRLPRSAHTPLEWRRAYDSELLQAEPIWLTAAKAGRRVLVLQAPGAHPFTGEHPDHLLMFDIYNNRQLPQGDLSGRLVEGRYRFTLGDDAFDVTSAPGTGLRLASRGRLAVLGPGREGRFSDPFPIRIAGQEGLVRFRLLSHDRAAGTFRLLHGVASTTVSNHPSRVPEFTRLAGTIVGEAIVEMYQQGGLGRTLAENGDGMAEWWLADYLRANQEYFDGSVAFAASEPWDLLVTYVPNLDATLHALVGMLDPASGKYRADLADRVWPIAERLFEVTAESVIRQLRGRFPDATLVIVSDHGMEGASRRIAPNVALARAGLLNVTPAGAIDLGRTKALFQQQKGLMMFINSADWKTGIVPLDEVAQVKRAAAAALLGMRDPHTRGPVVRAIFDPEIDGTALGIGGATGGDLYFDLEPGYYVAAGTDGLEVIDADPPGLGFHGAAPWRRKLQSIFYAVGPGVAAGRRLGVIRAIDVAPTVARLLDIPAPAQSQGQALDLQ